MSETVVPECVKEWEDAASGCRHGGGGARWVEKTRRVQQVGRGVYVTSSVALAGACTARANPVTGRESLVGSAWVLDVPRCCEVWRRLSWRVKGTPRRVDVGVGVVSSEVD